MPKVSVIVPVYKVEEQIGRCIESIQRQTLVDWELILIDDCSPDNSFDIIRNYAQNDRRIIVKRHDINHGPMIARRWGDELASGDYITYCDGDDTLPDNALITLYNDALEYDADVVIGSFMYIKANGEHKEETSDSFIINSGADLFKLLLRQKIRQTLCGKLFKADLLKDHDYRVVDRMTNAEDAYLLYQMIPYIKKAVKTSRVVYNYIQNCESSSQRRYSENALENIMQVNSLRVSLINDYPYLKKDILGLVSEVLTELVIAGYDKDGLLSMLMAKYGLQNFCSDRTVIATHTCLDSFKLLLRKHILKH